jgi:hypothetical protein
MKKVKSRTSLIGLDNPAFLPDQLASNSNVRRKRKRRSRSRSKSRDRYSEASKKDNRKREDAGYQGSRMNSPKKAHQGDFCCSC